MKVKHTFGNVDQWKYTTTHSKGLGMFTPTNVERALGLLYQYGAKLEDKKWKKKKSSNN